MKDRKSGRLNATSLRRMAGAASKLALLAGVSAAPVQHVSAQEEAAAAAGEAEGKGLTEVVVTATRVESLASKTPLALSVFDADALRDANVSTVAQLGEIVPNLEVNRNFGLQFTLRGVTSNDTTEKGDPSVVMLNDGRYIARREFAEASFFDVARLEVLRGPQGTLYGRNATAGVVNVITHKPTHEFESTVNGSVGNYGTRQMDAMVNVPVSDAIALRVAAVYDKQDNFQNQDYETEFDLETFKDNKAVRLQALFDITEDMNLLLRTEYSSLGGNPHTSGAPASNFYLETDEIGGTPVYIGGSKSTRELLTEHREPGMQGRRDDSTFAFEADFVWNLGAVDLTYLGSYRTFDRDWDNNIFINGFPRGTGMPVRAEFRQDEHELRISMTGEGPLQAQAGIYSFEERTDLELCLLDLVPGFPALCYIRTPTEQTSMSERLEVNILRSGEIRWFMTCKRPLYDNDGRILGSYGLSHDLDRTSFSLKALDQLKASIDFIRKHHARQISIAELAATSCLSVSALERRFHKYLAKTPNQFINEVRLESARRLLLDSTLSIAAIAHKTGFADPGYFTRQFFKHFGELPSDCRENPQVKVLPRVRPEKPQRSRQREETPR